MESGFYWVEIPNISNRVTTGGQIVGKPGLSVHSVEVDRTANAIKSPVERGHYVFDNKVIMPLEVTVNIIVKENEWDSVWSELERMYNNRSYEFYTVCTRGEVIGNLMLVGLPRKETPDKWDAVELTLKFVQVVIASEGRTYASISNPAKKSDTSTQSTGQKVLSILKNGLLANPAIRLAFHANRFMSYGSD